MNTPKKHSTGFTLLELLVVMVLLSVVTTIGTTMFFEVSNLWRQTALRANLAQTAQTALDVMANDISQTLAHSRTGVPVEGRQRGFEYASPDSPYWRVQLENDVLTLPVTFPNYVSGKQDRVRVRYTVERDGSSHRLVRSILPLHGGTEEPLLHSSAIADGVMGLRAEFWNGAQWLPEWLPADMETAMPRQIRISLTLQDVNRPYEQLSRQAVYPVHVE